MKKNAEGMYKFYRFQTKLIDALSRWMRSRAMDAKNEEYAKKLLPIDKYPAHKRMSRYLRCHRLHDFR